MHVVNHNWSATKPHVHPHGVAEISRHSVLSGYRIRPCGTSSESRHKDTVTYWKVWSKALVDGASCQGIKS